MSNLDIDLIDTLDLINYTLSDKFIDNWKDKYSEKFIKLFQLKLLDCFNNSKPIKVDTLFTYFTKNNKYSPEQVSNFFKSIDIGLYYPIICGSSKKIKLA